MPTFLKNIAYIKCFLGGEFLYFAGSSTEILQARKHLTSLRWFVKENFLESRRALRAYTRISKLLKYEDSCINWSDKPHISSVFWYFEFLYFAGSSTEILQARKHLTSLRFFVKEKILESRRALRACTKISKLLKYEDLCINLSDIPHISSNFWDFEFLYFAGSSTEILQARKHLTSLRWFVKEKFLESRRALRA